MGLRTARTLPLLARRAAVEDTAAVGIEPAHRHTGRHLESLEDLAGLGDRRGGDRSLHDLRTLEERLREEEGGARFTALLSGPFASFALFLAVLGLYASLAELATQRTREIGVRMALGARPRQVFGLVARQGLLPTLAGVVLGLVAAGAVTRFLAGQLFGVSPLEPATFAAVAALLGLVALGACLLPARRAARIDPLAALRYD